LLARRI
jgi:hypothetical protein